ncbi:ferrochelatase [Sphingomonas sp.]|uniref:ferrochelatase n=1 Tax=Sphingomonas sp. TaxID=28214 RepID=UPI000DB89A27|nr:ferrochelatase [Sphingomonas sp.]PZU10080.1 MAG: ferrochelatase [Sphingomonas sp.]
MTRPADHPAIPSPRIGVLLVNLGTPDAPDTGSVRRYLKEFLSDRRVVELPPWLWQPILRGVVLTTRPRKSAHAYQQVWSEEGSPLAAITRAQAKALAGRLEERGVLVDHAMRYGRPAIAERIAAMKAAGCERILLAPLYPQYSGATTATAHDAAFAGLAAMRWQPAIRTLPPYHDDPAYICALAESVKAGLAGLDFVPDAIVASFHGMPRRTLDLGDPYHCQCVKTARLLSEALDHELIVSFQSRFGKAKWLEPATDVRLADLGSAGRKVAIVAPGFSADCLETLEELAIRGRETFRGAGGRDFAYLPCLNASEAGNKMIEMLVLRELAGWLAAS